MIVEFKSSFIRDVKPINDKSILIEIENSIKLVESAKKLNEITNIKKLKGYKTYYRIKIGIYRIGINFIDDKVIFVRFLHRKDVYKKFPV